MVRKRKSTPAWNPLRSGASSSSDPTLSHIRFRDDDAFKAFLENFSRRGIHSERQLILTDFVDIDLPSVIHSRGWESLCEHLRTVSRDELMSAFCERPSAWGECLFTPCRPFAKGPRFMNMVMTFVLHLLSHYNSITEPRARFLLPLLEHLTIDFSSHFILSIIDVHLDSASHDKLIFPSAITRILCHFSVPFPFSDHFTVMCAIDYATVKRSEAQLRSWQSNPATPPSHSASSRSAPSTSAPPSSSADVTLGDIMAQLQHMDARLDTLSTKLY